MSKSSHTTLCVGNSNVGALLLSKHVWDDSACYFNSDFGYFSKVGFFVLLP